MTKKKKFNSSMDFVPSAKYKEPIPEVLVIFDSGFGSKKIVVKRVSAEEIKLPDGNILYAGVPAQPEHYRDMKFKARIKESIYKLIPFKHFSTWNIISTNYAFAGHPFTFHPQTMKIITDEKKRSILVDQRICIPVNISSNKTIYVAIYRFGEKAGEPVFKDKIPEDLKTKLKDKKGKAKLEAFYDWIDENKEEIKNMDVNELPVKTEYDVTEMEMVRNEWSQIIYGNAMKKYAEVQDAISDKEDKSMWFMLIMAGALVSVVGLFLYFANEGVFGY